MRARLRTIKCAYTSVYDAKRALGTSLSNFGLHRSYLHTSHNCITE